MRRRPAFVITLSTLSTLGCNGTTQPPTANPPGTAAQPSAAASATASSTQTQAPTAWVDGAALNPKTADGDTIYLSADGASCYVTVRPAKPPVALVPPEQKVVACPPAFSDPAWKSCAHGTIAPQQGGTVCTCMPAFANPPPVPPLPVVKCPAH